MPRRNGNGGRGDEQVKARRARAADQVPRPPHINERRAARSRQPYTFRR